MDPLDLAVYRFLSPGGEARFWAGRRILDPRITSREIAARVGISESGVRHRLRRLTDAGFLRDRTVLPNPSLFGQYLFVADLRISQSREVDRILRDLALIEGVVFIRDVLDENERKIQVYLVAETEAAAARRATLIGRLSASGGPLRPRPYYVPPAGRDLTSLEWRVLLFLRHNAEASLADIGEAVRISLKSASRCFHHLIDSRAASWTHGPTSEEFPLALVRVDLEKAAHRDPVTGWIAESEHAWIPVASDGIGLAPETATTVVAGLVPADVPTALERYLRRLASVEGVSGVRRTFALGSAFYSQWFTDRIAHRVLAGR